VDNLYNEENKSLAAIENYRVMIELSEEIFHDFKNILATISGLAQLSMITTEADELSNYLSHINQATFEFRDTLDRYYSYTNGYLQESTEPYVLYSIINKATEMLRFRLHEPNSFGNGINLNLNVLSSSKVVCNEYELKQCFLNIMMNAIDSMDETGGTLTVDIYNSEDCSYVYVDISDTGTGISTENLDKVFKYKFTTKTKGTGLGLKIAKNCVEKFGGSISIFSKVNQGTKISIKLPVCNEVDITN